MTSVGKNVEKLESLCPVDVNGSDIAAKENSMIMPPKWNIQLVWDPEFHFWIGAQNIWRWHFKEIFVHPHSWEHYSE